MAYELVTPKWLVDESVGRIKNYFGVGWQNVKTETGLRCGCPCGCQKEFAFPLKGKPEDGWQRYGDAVICDDCAMRNQVIRAVSAVGW